MSAFSAAPVSTLRDLIRAWEKFGLSIGEASCSLQKLKTTRTAFYDMAADSKKREIHHRLMEWANWRARAHGYPAKASFLAGLTGGMGGEFRSGPPRGTEMPEHVGRLQSCMAEAESAGFGLEIGMVRSYYLRAEGRTAADVAKVFEDCNANRLLRTVETAKSVLAGMLIAKGEVFH